MIINVVIMVTQANIAKYRLDFMDFQVLKINNLVVSRVILDSKNRFN